MLRDAPLYGFAGDFRRLSEFKGRPLIINVWASWCGPCMEELPEIGKLATALKGRRIQVVSVSHDDDWQAADDALVKAKLGMK